MKEVLQELLDAKSFRQFTIVMNGGTKYEAVNRDLIVTGKDVLYLYHTRSDRYDVLRLAEISAFEVAGLA